VKRKSREVEGFYITSDKDVAAQSYVFMDELRKGRAIPSGELSHQVELLQPLTMSSIQRAVAVTNQFLTVAEQHGFVITEELHLIPDATIWSQYMIVDYYQFTRTIEACLLEAGKQLLHGDAETTVVHDFLEVYDDGVLGIIMTNPSAQGEYKRSDYDEKTKLIALLKEKVGEGE
jgi:hypothetical protein